MAEVVVLGAGLSGTIMAYELMPQLRDSDALTVIGQGPRYHFCPQTRGLPLAGEIEPISRSIFMK